MFSCSRVEASHQLAASPDTQNYSSQNRRACSRDFSLTAVHRPALNNNNNNNTENNVYRVPRPRALEPSRGSVARYRYVALLFSSPAWLVENDCNQPPPTSPCMQPLSSEQLSDGEAHQHKDLALARHVCVLLPSPGRYPSFCLRHCHINLSRRARLHLCVLTLLSRGHYF
jgi:hypothetical protein